MIGIGIVGCGTIAKHRHVPEFSMNSDSRIIGYFNPNKNKSEILAAQYGGKVYTTYEDMLKDKAIDAFCICSPNKYHASDSIAAMNAGKHVLVEKPMAVSMEEGDAMIETASRNNRLLMVAHDMKFEYAIKKAKEIIKSGELGKILSFRTTLAHGGPEHWATEKGINSWFFKKENASDGVLGDLGVHKAHLIAWLIDDFIVEIKAFSAVLDKRNENGNFVDTEDNSICLLRSKSGIIGTLTVSWTNYGEMDKSTVLYCTNGTIEIYCHPDAPLIVTKKSKERICHTFENQNNSGVADAFINSIKNNLSSEVSGEEALRALRVILGCIEASEKNSTVTIKC
ncbi:hypothetical protein acsn021_30550 [Anaerocolumna cellulosilytica]|uniref:Dehydrogenase n=1 Tax=Anaerocolumna cellulosilytica TaxID=433286 RepID=A0A6S6R0B3_9FIRM|nr:Gfo/Idh/MocA family oxidoreductase [Anaerocolumna cellulosilytica]MBB5197467.1 putative dehydrogenase [Anaerocolumna cellulosilytica]BCJ95486.1 hypothetical protein acsn021_30550 [Anaerocolumna cellulosilytica]